MILSRWDRDAGRYLPHEVPDDWNCKTYSTDMDEIVNCAQCGRELPFGKCFTSLEVHTKVGFGYAVCEPCHGEEFERKHGKDDSR